MTKLMCLYSHEEGTEGNSGPNESSHDESSRHRFDMHIGLWTLEGPSFWAVVCVLQMILQVLLRCDWLPAASQLGWLELLRCSPAHGQAKPSVTDLSQVRVTSLFACPSVLRCCILKPEVGRLPVQPSERSLLIGWLSNRHVISRLWQKFRCFQRMSQYLTKWHVVAQLHRNSRCRTNRQYTGQFQTQKLATIVYEIGPPKHV